MSKPVELTGHSSRALTLAYGIVFFKVPSKGAAVAILAQVIVVWEFYPFMGVTTHDASFPVMDLAIGTTRAAKDAETSPRAAQPPKPTKAQ
jgi:hypothetical protein